jgi:hypothetical protein
MKIERSHILVKNGVDVPQRQVVMSVDEAKQLAEELRPHLTGFVVGEHKKCERLCKLVGVHLDLVN